MGFLPKILMIIQCFQGIYNLSFTSRDREMMLLLRSIAHWGVGVDSSGRLEFTIRDPIWLPTISLYMDVLSATSSIRSSKLSVYVGKGEVSPWNEGD